MRLCAVAAAGTGIDVEVLRACQPATTRNSCSGSVPRLCASLARASVSAPAVSRQRHRGEQRNRSTSDARGGA